MAMIRPIDMKEEEHFIGKVAQKAIIVHDDKVLLTRDPRIKDEIWELPGGRLNVDEDPKEGLRRELKEELGADFEVREVIYLKQFRQGSEQARALAIVYLAVLEDPETIKPNKAEVSEHRWFDEQDCLDLKMFDEYRAALSLFFSSRHRGLVSI